MTDIDSILAHVDMSPAEGPTIPKKPADLAGISALPEAWRQRVSERGRRALYAALGEGKTEAVALALGEKAAGDEYDVLVAEERARYATRTATVAAPPAAATAAPAPVRGVTVDAVGAARSRTDVALLRGAGFAPKESLYERGTMVIEAGVENARRARADFDALPLVSDVCADLGRKIREERRRIVELPCSAVSMLDDGRMVLDATPYPVTKHGFAGMVERLGYGGSTYLAGACDAPLRALNVNAQRDIILAGEARARSESKGKPIDPRKIAARIRTTKSGEEVFAGVGPGYAAFDADRIAEAFAAAMPRGAKGTVAYDNGTTSTRFEALFHSDVKPEHYVAGEVFQVGIRVRSSDSGDGGIQVRSVALQNLCLNLIILDRMCRPVASIRHTGDVAKLAKAFSAALARSTRALAPFMDRWNSACAEDVASLLRGQGVALPTAPSEIARGVFAGLLQGRRVRFPRLADFNRQAILADLVASWEADVSGAKLLFGGITRGAIVNAFTRSAQHWLGAEDPFASDQIELDASKLLWGDGGGAPSPLPFFDPLKVEEEPESDRMVTLN